MTQSERISRPLTNVSTAFQRLTYSLLTVVMPKGLEIRGSCWKDDDPAGNANLVFL